jgi:hypothetical protein
MIQFPKYAEVKDNYCLCYFGYSDEYLFQLKLLKPILERYFAGIKIHISCKDDKVHLLEGCKHIAKISELKSRQFNFGHIKEIKYNGTTHPIEDLMIETGIKEYFVPTEYKEDHTVKCVILSQGNYPTVNLNKRQIDDAIRLARKEGFEPEVDSNIRNAGLVIGVENLEFFKAAAQGITTRLVPTGVGARLYRKMFSNSIVLDI